MTIKSDSRDRPEVRSTTEHQSGWTTTSKGRGHQPGDSLQEHDWMQHLNGSGLMPRA